MYMYVGRRAPARRRRKQSAWAEAASKRGKEVAGTHVCVHVLHVYICSSLAMDFKYISMYMYAICVHSQNYDDC